MTRQNTDAHDDVMFQAIKKDLAALKSSWRWRLGHGVISLVERILGRQSHHLAVDHIERMLGLWQKMSSKSSTATSYQDWTGYDFQGCQPAPHVIALLCSHDQPGDHREGDYYTAMELAEVIDAELGWTVHLIKSIRDIPPSVTTVISLLHDVPITPIRDDVCCIAWARSHGEYWIRRPWMDRFDLFLCSSHKLADFIGKATSKPSYLFPIATNPQRMRSGEAMEKAYDLTFIGSKRPKSPRLLEDILSEKDGELSIDLFGSGWEEDKTTEVNVHGFLNYDDVASTYAKSRYLLDSGHEQSLKWHALNSRVFDGFAVGSPVLSDNVQGYSELLDAEKLTYTDRHTLLRLLREGDRVHQDTKRVQELVLNRHTYARRAHLLGTILQARQIGPKTIHIHIATTDCLTVERWGDYHLAAGLKKALESLGHEATIVLKGHHGTDDLPDLDLDICGLHLPELRKGKKKAVWLISHPAQHIKHGFESADLVFASSEKLIALVNSSQADTDIQLLPQCTDPDIYSPRTSDTEDRYTDKIIYVAHRRSVPRLLEDFDFMKYDIHVIGQGWHRHIPDEMILSEELTTSALAQAYSSAAAIIIDHHDDMRALGIHSNKVYDVLACGGRVLCDIPASQDMSSYDDQLIHYANMDHLAVQIAHVRMTPKVSPHVTLQRDTYLHRAMQILSKLYV